MSIVPGECSALNKLQQRRVLRDELAALADRYAATLDEAEIQRLTGESQCAAVAPLAALGEDLLLLAEIRRESGWVLLTRRLCALGG